MAIKVGVYKKEVFFVVVIFKKFFVYVILSLEISGGFIIVPAEG